MNDILGYLLSYEALAVVLALTYVILAIKQSLWCWPVAAFSASIYVILFMESRLYMEALLQGCYVLMAGYGLWQWKFGERGEDSLVISTKGWKWHIGFIAGIAVASVLVAYYMQTYTRADSVMLDTFTTVASLAVQWMVAKKILENWLYWIVIDAFYVYLFATEGFWLTALLYSAFLVMAGYGYKQWQAQLKPSGSEA
ncbi:MULTISPECIES: nicotinamide riboside transporter PnuC [Gammaproteobacteria]|uniref:nicotinamide riboside transporter PnuC n=1 Tax=Gammaproteobacteria TaxID=1236 RepID=UPI000DD0145E|nr:MULTISPECIES: nicotinamide riboside transporter PnuC [Gammaproteobacteria]RTE85751.1 nicotinamide riboside transporter PnuC [Aliidiomarina sp. B3213]TCZ90247.1 nicotinamide riboside transporter PnuC [Lysobacter sp. N42]